MFDGFLFPFQQYNSKKKLLSDSSLLARQKLLKIKAKSLSSLNKNINTFKQWINQALTVAGFLLMIHPVHSRLLPLVNSGVPVMVDKITQYWITYKTAEFRKILLSCSMNHNDMENAEKLLKEFAEMMLLDLPESAKEILKEAAFAVSTQLTVLEAAQIKSLAQHHSEQLWQVQEVA